MSCHRFDGMTWPLPNEEMGNLEWRLRYNPPASMMQRDLLAAAGIISAYMQMVHDPESVRRVVVRELRGTMANRAESLFYLQDSRSYVGNDVFWWAKDGKGYTTELSKAHVYSKDDAQSRHNKRVTDIPWPKDYIDSRTRPAVDMQYIKIDDALAGTGIVLRTKRGSTNG